MSGAGAGATVCWRVTISGEPSSGVAFATNRNVITAKPTIAKKERAGIAPIQPDVTIKRSYSLVELQRSHAGKGPNLQPSSVRFIDLH